MGPICFGGILVSYEPEAGGRMIPASPPQHGGYPSRALGCVWGGCPHLARSPLKNTPLGPKEPERAAKPRAPGLVPSAGSLLPAGHGQMMCEAPSLAGSLFCSRGSSAVILALTPDNLVLSRTGRWFLGKRGGRGGVGVAGWCVSNEAGKERVRCLCSAQSK